MCVRNRCGHLQIGFRKFSSGVLNQSWHIYKVLKFPLGGISLGCWDLVCVCWHSLHHASVLSDSPVESFLLHVLESYYHFKWAVSTLCLPCPDHRLLLDSGNVRKLFLTSLRLRQTLPASDPSCYSPIFSAVDERWYDFPLSLGPQPSGWLPLFTTPNTARGWGGRGAQPVSISLT